MPARRKIKLVIAYDGTEYHGWQIQPGLKTVQGTLCKAASALLGHRTHVQGASRTDTGVHARGQVGLIDTTYPVLVDHLPLALNHRLPEDIVVRHAEEVGLDFDVMADVTRKAYRYTICAGPIRPIRQMRFCWHFPAPLAVEAMHTAAQCLVGSWDFRSFAVRLDKNQNTVRTVFRCEVRRARDEDADLVVIDLEADGFLHHMARIIAGTLVAIGRGRWPPEHMTEVLRARRRGAAGYLAPARGLSLEWIKFRPDAPYPAGDRLRSRADAADEPEPANTGP